MHTGSISGSFAPTALPAAVHPHLANVDLARDPTPTLTHPPHPPSAPAPSTGCCHQKTAGPILCQTRAHPATARAASGGRRGGGRGGGWRPRETFSSCWGCHTGSPGSATAPRRPGAGIATRDIRVWRVQVLCICVVQRCCVQTCTQDQGCIAPEVPRCSKCGNWMSIEDPHVQGVSRLVTWRRTLGGCYFERHEGGQQHSSLGLITRLGCNTILTAVKGRYLERCPTQDKCERASSPASNVPWGSRCAARRAAGTARHSAASASRLTP